MAETNFDIIKLKLALSNALQSSGDFYLDKLLKGSEYGEDLSHLITPGERKVREAWHNQLKKFEELANSDIHIIPPDDQHELQYYDKSLTSLIHSSLIDDLKVNKEYHNLYSSLKERRKNLDKEEREMLYGLDITLEQDDFDSYEEICSLLSYLAQCKFRLK